MTAYPQTHLLTLVQLLKGSFGCNTVWIQEKPYQLLNINISVKHSAARQVDKDKDTIVATAEKWTEDEMHYLHCKAVKNTSLHTPSLPIPLTSWFLFISSSIVSFSTSAVGLPLQHHCRRGSCVCDIFPLFISGPWSYCVLCFVRLLVFKPSSQPYAVSCRLAFGTPRISNNKYI